MPALSEWQTFFAVQAGAAATLTGLVFVAVSINLTRILNTLGLPGRVAEALVQFLQVFFICTAALIPGQPVTALAIEVLAIALISWSTQVTTQVIYARSRADHPWLWLVFRIIQTQLASLPFFVASAYLLLGRSIGLDWLVLGFAFSFVAGVSNAWVLLIEIVR
jgi:modulator of FtsH protease